MSTEHNAEDCYAVWHLYWVSHAMLNVVMFSVIMLSVVAPFSLIAEDKNTKTKTLLTTSGKGAMTFVQTTCVRLSFFLWLFVLTTFVQINFLWKCYFEFWSNCICYIGIRSIAKCSNDICLNEICSDDICSDDICSNYICSNDMCSKDICSNDIHYNDIHSKM